jgi:16S rRNA (guanine527-N7)-methyltransferase
MEEKGTDMLSSAAATLGITLGEKQQELFTIYCEELLLWNERINLVSIKSPADIWIKHFIDSLTAVPYITTPTGRLLDIGSGAGFPGIPLKISLNSLDVFLLEASRKRVSFLKHLCRRLRLDGVDIIHERVEDLIREDRYLASFDTVISRASFKLPELLTCGAPFLTENGRLIVLKGPDIIDELRDAAAVEKSCDLVQGGVYDLELPRTGDRRKIVIYNKYLK